MKLLLIYHFTLKFKNQKKLHENLIKSLSNLKLKFDLSFERINEPLLLIFSSSRKIL